MLTNKLHALLGVSLLFLSTTLLFAYDVPGPFNNSVTYIQHTGAFYGS